MVRVQMDDERATVYREGGIAFARLVPGIGWVLDDEPSEAIQSLAWAARSVAFPGLVPVMLAEVS